jgi:31-O-methyltransferase
MSEGTESVPPPAGGDEPRRAFTRLHHPDQAQLMFQVNEIFLQRLYLRHGIRVDPGAVVLDVGANIGVAAAFFSDECGAGLVHSFEPVLPVYELLAANLRSFPVCVPHNFGLSSKERDATIAYYPQADGMSSIYADSEKDQKFVRTYMENQGVPGDEIAARLEGRYEPVMLPCKLRTLASVLDEYALDRIDLLKIDVERSELDVLRGIGPAQWSKIGQIVAEVHDEDGRLATIVGLLDDHGFCVVVEQEPELRGTAVSVVYATR